MATRYTVEVLLHLRESPLCTKPNTLPPAEEWMGAPPETFRNSQGTAKTGTERAKNNDSLLDQTNRRPGADRHVSRNSTNPEDIILGPPRTTFSSATLSRGSKPFDTDKTSKEPESKDRFATFRTRTGTGDADTERPRDRAGDRDREGRNNFRRRGEADQDSDGWSTVKPRKSFGHEGAERFHGRMGERPERLAGGERRTREATQEENGEKPVRRSNFGEFGRDKEVVEDGERPRRNGLNRNRSDQPSWARAATTGEAEPPPPPPPARERFDRAKSWRERGREEQQGDDRPKERNADRRWDRDHRQEREPEWLDEPAEDKAQGHTVEDFQKFMESMKAGKSAAAKPEQSQMPTVFDNSPHDESLESDKSKVRSAPPVEMGPDKFFANFAATPNPDMANPLEGPKESATSKSKTGSRFQNFFSSQEDRRQPEPPAPAAGPPPPQQEPNPLLAFANAVSSMGQNNGSANQPSPAEKVAFQALLQKLQKQSFSNTPPPGGFSVPPPSNDMGPKSAVASPSPYQPYGHDHLDHPSNRGPPPSFQEMHAGRPQQATQLPPMREQQMLQELMGQHHPLPPQTSGREDQNMSRNSNNNAQFLMGLMKGGRNMPEPPRVEQHIRMPQPSRPAQIPQTPDREPDYQRERSASQHQGRPQGLPQFFDEAQLHHHEQDNRRQQQPTQILQRQGPPGLDHMHPNWMQGGNQQLPPGPGRPMIPPPGLAGNPRNGPMPGIFPPNFPMGGFPPEAMAGPQRNMAPPPGFFGGPPPPGFMPPPGMGGGFHGGPEALGFGFDGRGLHGGRAMPPHGAGGFRQN